MSIKYALVSRDPQMPLADFSTEPTTSDNLKKFLTSKLAEANPGRNGYNLNQDYVAFVLNEDRLLFGCVCDHAYNEEKAF